ncbi:MAG: TraR/DksA family transcriptional regulator [Acidimicrobiales bacterium]
MTEVDLQSAERRLADVEAALARLEEDSYGRCAACRGQIADSSLAANPLTTLCDHCLDARSSGDNAKDG